MSIPPIYDPRHTTGLTPVHKDVKHPLVYDPRRPSERMRHHNVPGTGSRRRTLLALFAFLCVLLVLLVLALWFVASVATAP